MHFATRQDLGTSSQPLFIACCRRKPVAPSNLRLVVGRLMRDTGRSLNPRANDRQIKSRRVFMRKLTVSLCLAFAFFVASAVAQTAPAGGRQGTQNSSPSMQQPGQYPNQQPGMGQPDNTAPTAQTDQGSANQNRNSGEHKLKGCVQSQGGQYVLETKKGKTV